MLTNEGKVALQKFSVGIKPGLCESAVLVFANYIVHNVGKKPCDHQDLHVITLPAVLQVCWDLLKTYTLLDEDTIDGSVKVKCFLFVPLCI